MIFSNLKKIKNQYVSCLISSLNYDINGMVQDIDNERIVLSINNVLKTYSLGEVDAIILDKKIIYANNDFIDSIYNNKKDDITNDEKKMLYVFFQIVEGYSVNYGFKDNSICIKKMNDYWYSFNVINNEITRINKYIDLIDLLMRLFDDLTDNCDYEAVWLKEFNRLIKREYSITENDYYEDYLLQKYRKSIND